MSKSKNKANITNENSNLENKIFDLKKKFKDKKSSTTKGNKDFANNSFKANYNN